ncbi:MAG: pyridoxamine 5'-phosphate oxidase family protein [Pseudomonadales bacterium]|nr:pyridoxamine 5'-phosphate oxidase family protein [Pseudomonadales bacterium]
MKNTAMQDRLQQEILKFIDSRKTLQLASITDAGEPFSSYAPFAQGEDCIYVLLSDIATHAKNLKANDKASVLIVEDEDSAEEIFARIRINYSMRVEHIAVDSEAWDKGIQTLENRLGKLSRTLSEMSDFNLFKLIPVRGRYVKGFGEAYSFIGESLTGTAMDHLTDGHIKRAS